MRCALLLLTVSCSALDPGDSTCEGKCDGEGADATCDDARYADGTCHLDLACATPDFDCFVTFDGEAAARTWFAEFEATMAMQEVREPRRLLDETDARYPRMRELLDRGWQSYREKIPVGKLGSHTPALVLVEDETVNAFVAPSLDLGKAGLAVMVQTGLLDENPTDEQLLGVVMHELEHAVGLHVIPARRESIRRYYQVLPGQPEPFGFEQTTQPAAKEAIDALATIGQEVGLYPYEELDGLPWLGAMLWKTLQLAHSAGVQRDAAACQDADAAAELLREFVLEHLRMVDGALVLGDDGAELAYVSHEYTVALREQCLAGSTATIYDYLALQLGVPAEMIRAGTPPEDQALVEGKHIVDAIQAVTRDRYAKIGAVETALQTASGGGIDSLRWFTMEEAADDVTVPVLDHAGLSPLGNADFLLRIALPEADQQACQEILDRGEMPPYGADLADEHHATCWRVWHIQKLAERDKGKGAAASRWLPPPPARATERPPSQRLRDHVPDCGFDR